MNTVNKQTNPRAHNIGKTNTDKEFKARWTILTALSDGQWHRNMELKKKTKLSSRTLDKHLDKMKHNQIIEKKEDVKNGKYAVFFKAKPTLITTTKAAISRQKIIYEIEPTLNETKDPLIILDIIHTSSQLYFLQLLELIQQDKNITNEQINFFKECFLWPHYEQYTSKLIDASRKIISDINISQSLINQARREKENSQQILKRWEQQ